MHSAKTISIKEIEQIYFFELTCFCGKFRLVVLINNDAIVTHFENKNEHQETNAEISEDHIKSPFQLQAGAVGFHL